MIIVLDTNVLLSGLIYPESIPGRIVNAWTEARFDIVSSFYQLEEISRVLAYPKIRRILKWDDQIIEQFIKQLYIRIEIIDPDTSDIEVPRDPSDAPILAILKSSNAEILITGDQDLLSLRESYPIETPAEFICRL